MERHFKDVQFFAGEGEVFTYFQQSDTFRTLTFQISLPLAL